MITDTGSTTLGVAGAACSSCGVTPEYTPGTTAVDEHATSTSMYGDNSMWSGETYSDKVAVTGDPDGVTMRFGAMTSQTGFFQQGETDQGILGFGGSGLAVAGPTRTSTSARRASSRSSSARHGTLWLGEPTLARVVGAAALADGHVEPYLMLDVTSAGRQLVDRAVGRRGDGYRHEHHGVVLDRPGKLVSAVNAAGFSTIFGMPSRPAPPTSTATTPGTHTRARSTPRCPRCRSRCRRPAADSFTVCVGVGVVHDADRRHVLLRRRDRLRIPVTIMGDAFLRGFVTTFDLQNKQIGLASQAGCTLPTAIPPDHVEHRPYRLGHPSAATAP